VWTDPAGCGSNTGKSSAIV